MSPQFSDSHRDLEPHDASPVGVSLALRNSLSFERMLGYILWTVLTVVVFGVGTL